MCTVLEYLALTCIFQRCVTYHCSSLCITCEKVYDLDLLLLSVPYDVDTMSSCLWIQLPRRYESSLVSFSWLTGKRETCYIGKGGFPGAGNTHRFPNSSHYLYVNIRSLEFNLTRRKVCVSVERKRHPGSVRSRNTRKRHLRCELASGFRSSPS